MQQLPIYILAGGSSSRFGADKARAQLDDRALIQHVADALAAAAEALCVVAERPGKYADLGLRTIGDSAAGLGPLDGLQAALRDLPPERDWLLLVACDVIGVRARWVDLLWGAVRDGGAPAAAFRGDRWQPLFALYHRALLPAVARQLAGGERALWQLLQQAGAAALLPPPDWGAAVDVDTPAQLAAAARARDTRGGRGA